MAFRRDSKVDAFQRQINALRQQLGGDADFFRDDSFVPSPGPAHGPTYRNEFPDLEPPRPESEPTLGERLSPSRSLMDAPLPDLPAIPSIDNATSVVAHSTAWTGSLESTGSLHVYGRVEGSLTARDDIFIAEEAEVDAAIVAANVTIAGKVRGSVQCSRRFEVLPNGRVSADIRSPAIVIHDGALLTGEILMSSTAEPRGRLSAIPAARAANGGD